VDIKRLVSTFTYRIEAKPEGGFIARASDPNLPPIEAATRFELRQKIQDNINAAMAAQFPGLNLPAKSPQVKFDFHIEAKPGGGFSIHSAGAGSDAVESEVHQDIEHPFAEKLVSMLAGHLNPELMTALQNQGNAGEVKVFVNGRTFGGKTPIAGAPQALPGGTIDGAPILPEAPTSWKILRFVLTLLAAAAIMYYFMHR